MRNNRRPDEKFRGTHFGDEFKEWLKGYTKRELSTHDATQLSNEVYNYKDDLFPLRRVPVPDNPGRHTLEQNYFHITYESGRAQKDLTEYLLDEDRYNNEVYYAGAHGLAEFFEFCFHHLLVNGIAAYAIGWEEIQINKKKWIVPSSFNSVNTATIDIVKDEDKDIVQQRFSWLSKILNDYYEYKDQDFLREDTLIYKYPNRDEGSPVEASLKYISALNQGMEYSLLQGEAGNNPKNHSLELELARYTPASYYWRKQNITRVKVKRIFNQKVGDSGVGVTTYYELYSYIEYRKHLNIVRDYLVQQFNEQVISQIAGKNNLKRHFHLKYEGFKTNEEIEKAWDQYNKEAISFDELFAMIKDPE